MQFGVLWLLKFQPVQVNRHRKDACACAHAESRQSGTVALLGDHENGPLTEFRCAGNLIPGPKALYTNSTVIGSREQVTSGSEMRSGDSVDVKNAGVSGRLDALKVVSRQHSCAAGA